MNRKNIFLITILFSAVASAQVKIGGANGTPNASSMLHIEANNKGILIPQIALKTITDQLQTNILNANSLLIYNTAIVLAQGLTPGYYYWDNSGWVRLASQHDVPISAKVFYMPSIVINTSTITPAGVEWKRNLYGEYIAQFTGKEFVPDTSTGGNISSNNSAKFIKSTSAPAVIPNIPSATSLHYYVTDYDATALEIISIDDNGIMTYKVKGTGTDYSFVNIVFVVK